MYYAFLGLAVLSLVFLVLIRCRGRNPKLKEFSYYAYAHRGLHNEQVPENSMSAFRRAVMYGYGAELDVHLLKDGNLAVFHDSDLKRMTGQEGIIEELTAEDLKNYHLNGTEETIPLLEDVLKVFEGKTPLIVELKSANNVAQLTETACKMLDRYHVQYCMESFDPRCVRWLRKNRPDVVRGQLSENFLRDKNSKFPFLLRFCMTFLFTNVVTRPDFIAYRYRDRKQIAFQLCLSVWKAKGVAWTLRTKQEYDNAVALKLLPIFEDFLP